MTTTGHSEGAPYVAPNGTIYFYDNPNVGGVAAQLKLAMSTGPTTFGVASGITGFDNYEQPVVTPDELEIFMNLGNVIYHASRASTGVAFGPLTTLDGLPGPVVAQATYVSADGCDLYYSADRAGGQGGRDIWMASRR